MQKFVLVAVSLALLNKGFSQFIPHSSQPVQYASIFNPAFVGVDPFLDSRLGYRYQWAGVDNAPRFLNLNVNARIQQPTDLARNAMRMSHSQTIKEPDYLPPLRRVIQGLGINVFHESVNIVQRSGAGVSYAYHYPVSKHSYVAAGVALSVENSRFDLDRLYFRDPDPFVEELLQRGTSYTMFNTRMGVLFHSQNVYAGFSYLPLWNKANQEGDLFISSFYQSTFLAAYSFPVTPNFLLRPNIVGLLQRDNTWVVDLSMKAMLQNVFWTGLTYRTSRAAVLLAGFDVNPQFTVTYSYELSLSTLRQFHDGSHELIIGFRLNNFRGLKSYLW